MTDVKRVGDSGIHTVEGTVAGNRAAVLTKQRDAQRAEYEAVKNKIKEDNAAGVGKIDDKFSSASDVLEQEFRRKTVGLVSATDFRKAREETIEIKVDTKAQEAKELKALQNKEKTRELKRKKIASSLSFEVNDGDEQEEGEEVAFVGKNKKRLKDPSVDTSYLPDRDRDAEINAKKAQLQKEWLEEQDRIKNEVDRR